MAKEEQEKTIEKEEEKNDVNEMLVSEETYLTSGVHIGTRQKTSDIKKFIYKVRNDGLYIIDVKKTDDRIKEAAKFINNFNPKETLVVSVRQYGQKPIQMFSKYTGVSVLEGRVRPGTLTNPNSPNYREPELLILTDPLADSQALVEAKNVNIPAVGLSDTNNEAKYLDLIIPTNNKGRRALALVYWLLTREVLKDRGAIESYEDFEPEIEDFEAEI
ncbi:MAG: 30S ribosomal protein S2 [Candidatus Thermoplasmatota archaeon]